MSAWCHCYLRVGMRYALIINLATLNSNYVITKLGSSETAFIPISTMSRKNSALTLGEKVRLIEMHNRGKCSVKFLISEFKCGKTQIYDALKNKESILSDWTSGKSSSAKRMRTSLNEDLNAAVFEWFCRARSKSIPLSGPMIQAQALEVAAKMGNHDFKASNGWLEAFRARHNIVWRDVCGEKNDVDLDVVAEWKSKISSLVEGYAPRDVYNGDETGLFFRLLPSKTLAISGETCCGGKMSKERLTVFVCGNMDGDLEKPIVIGKAQKPRCFRNLDRNALPVIWRWNRKAWMTGSLMEEWLQSFNGRMKRQNRKVLLFLDNAGCHPHIKLSNVKLVFFPPNTTAVTQPMDQGVIRSFKAWYRKFLLQYLVVKIDECNNVTELTKQVDVLAAINWIARALNKVASVTVRKCFEGSGFPLTVSLPNESETVLHDELTSLAQKCQMEIDVESLISFDDKLTTEISVDACDLLPLKDTEDNQHDDEEEEAEREDKIATFSQCMSVLKDLQAFSAAKNSPDLLAHFVEAEAMLSNLSMTSVKKQTTLDSYFK